MPVALGCSVHSGWAVIVAVAADEPAMLVDRRRLELVDPELPRQMYHAAQGLPLEQAAELVDRVERDAFARTAEVFGAAVDAVPAEHGEVTGCAVIGQPNDLPSLERILASHALLHAAEGELYREAIADAARRRGLHVVFVPPKEILLSVEVALGWSSERADAWLNELGRTFGPPWQKDHKQAALAALVALH